MVLTSIAIFTHIGIAPAAQRNAIIADFLPSGLEGLLNTSDDDVKDACTSYARREDGNFPVMLMVNQKQRLKGLMLWVKDRDRVGQPIQFEDGTTAAQLNAMLSESLDREEVRKEQKSNSKAYLDHEFNNKLKTQSQWENSTKK